MSTVTVERRSAHTNPARRPRGVAPNRNVSPCTYDPGLWDLDHSSFADAAHAAQLCGRCPLLESCAAQLRRDVVSGASPRSQIVAGHAFTHRGAELTTERALIKYITRRDGQRLRADDPDADPLEAAEAAPEESLEDLESAEASAAEAARAEERATLRALSREVETSCGTQFALDLGA